MPRCRGTYADGRPCTAGAKEFGFCGRHQPNHAPPASQGNNSRGNAPKAAKAATKQAGPQCLAYKQDGTRCVHPAKFINGMCGMHHNYNPAAAATPARRGPGPHGSNQQIHSGPVAQCMGHVKGGARCTHPGKFNGFCGMHVKSQQAPPPAGFSPNPGGVSPNAKGQTGLLKITLDGRTIFQGHGCYAPC
jgi:hypothetical protein